MGGNLKGVARAFAIGVLAVAGSGCSWIGGWFEKPAPPPPAPPEMPCPSPQAGPLEGWVLLSIRVRADGTVAGAKVVRSHPRGRFEDEAIERVSRAHFHPRLVDGKPVAQEGMQCVEFEKESI